MIALLASTALAMLDPSCDELVRPADYYEVRQQDFMMNHVALSTSFSPIHAPIPHAAGRGSLGVEAAVIPPLNCYQRAAYDYSKTEDTNKSPLLPRIRGSYVFSGKGVAIYVGTGFTPPVPVGGVSSYLFSGEIGVGGRVGRTQIGARAHGSLIRSVGEIAGPLEADGPVVDDLYVGSTLGLDVSVGIEVGEDRALVPYLALGITDVSTLFVVGDDGVVVSNFHPYFGPTASLGLDALLFDRIRAGGELYAAPGGFSRPEGAPADPEGSPSGFGAYGRLYTARVKVGLELGPSADNRKTKRRKK